MFEILFHPRLAPAAIVFFGLVWLASHFGMLDEHKTAFRVGAVVFGIALVSGGVVWQRAAKRRAAEEFERLPATDQAYLLLVAARRWHETLSLTETLVARMPENKRAAVATATPLAMLGRFGEAMERLNKVATATADAAIREQAGNLATDLRKARTSRRDSMLACALIGAFFAWAAVYVYPKSVAKHEWAGLGFIGGLSLLSFLTAIAQLVAGRSDRLGNPRPAAPAVHKALWRLYRAGEFQLARAVAEARLTICPSDSKARLVLDAIGNGQTGRVFRDDEVSAELLKE